MLANKAHLTGACTARVPWSTDVGVAAAADDDDDIYDAAAAY